MRCNEGLKWVKARVFAFCLLCLTGTVYGQEAKQVFIAMPDSLCPLLTKVNKEDCVDFLESNMRARVSNRFGEISRMTCLGKDYIHLQLSENTSWQMKLLTKQDSTRVTCIITTACATACDSSISFYTPTWDKLDSLDFLTLPALGDFWCVPDSVNENMAMEAWNLADPVFIKADFEESTTDLTFHCTTADYLDKQAAEKLRRFIRNPIVLRWKDNRFETEFQ